MNANMKITILSAIFAQEENFDCIQIMNYIRENEVNNKTIPHQEIAMYMDTLRGRGWIKVTDDSKEFTKFAVVLP